MLSSQNAYTIRTNTSFAVTKKEKTLYENEICAEIMNW